MFFKIVQSLGLGLLALLVLGVFPFFTAVWIYAMAAAIFLMSFFNQLAAWAVLGSLFLLTIAYHSFAVLALVLIVLMAVQILFGRMQTEPEAILLVFFTPYLAAAPFLGKPLAMEFLPLFLWPLFGDKKSAAIYAGGACFVSLMCAILINRDMMGNLYAGHAGFFFFEKKLPPANLFSFQWLQQNQSQPMLRLGLDKLKTFSVYWFRHPVLWLQIAVWAALGYFMTFLTGLRNVRGKILFTVMALLSGITALAGEQYAVSRFFGRRTPFNWNLYALKLMGAGLAGFVLLEVQAAWRAGETRERGLSAKTRPGSFEKTRDGGKPVRKVTLVDLAVIRSNLSGASDSLDNPSAIFQDFWKHADHEMNAGGGQLLSRAGEGSVYLFRDPEKAVHAGQKFAATLAQYKKDKALDQDTLDVRIGLDSGEVWFNDKGGGSGDAFSRLLVVTAQMQRLAGKNQICISKRTLERLKSRKGFQYRGMSEKGAVDYYLWAPERNQT